LKGERYVNRKINQQESRSTDVYGCQLPAESAQRQTQQLCSSQGLRGATRCDDEAAESRNETSRNSLPVAAFSDDLRRNANNSESAPSRTRTLNLLIKSLREWGKIADKTDKSGSRAALGAAVETGLGHRLADLLEAWEGLDDEQRRGVLAMLDGVLALADA